MYTEICTIITCHYLSLLEVVFYVFQIKKIDLEVSPEFTTSFKYSILIIWGYRQTLWEVEKLRTTRYDSDLSEHEEKLYQLWKMLMPHIPLEGRVTKQWQDIGFQVNQISYFKNTIF